MFDLTEADDGSLTARFVFPAEFTGFRGHFPEQPVLPAVCKIQAVVAMLEAKSMTLDSLLSLTTGSESTQVTAK